MENPHIVELVEGWKQKGLSVRAGYVLAKAGIAETELAAYDSVEALIGIRNCGGYTAQEIWDFMKDPKIEVKEVNFEDLIPK